MQQRLKPLVILWISCRSFGCSQSKWYQREISYDEDKISERGGGGLYTEKGAFNANAVPFCQITTPYPSLQIQPWYRMWEVILLKRNYSNQGPIPNRWYNQTEYSGDEIIEIINRNWFNMTVTSHLQNTFQNQERIGCAMSRKTFVVRTFKIQVWRATSAHKCLIVVPEVQ